MPPGSLVRRTAPAVLVTLLAFLGPAGCSRQARSAKLLARADADYAAGRLDQAELEYLNALQLDPQSAPATGRLGLIYFEEGRNGQVYALLARAAQLQPDDLDVRLRLGQFLLAAGKAADARAHATFILARRPLDPEAPLLLASSSTAEAEFADARRQLQEAAKTAGETPAILVALGSLDIRSRALDRAETNFRQALAKDPKFAAAWSALAALEFARGDKAAGAKALGAAADASPLRSARRLQYAQYLIQSGQEAEGRRLLGETVDRAPDYVPAREMLAELEARERNYAASAELNDRVLARDPLNFAATVLGARLKREMGVPAEGATRLEAALHAYPQSPVLRRELALCYLDARDPTKARDSLRQALTLAPDDAESAVLLAEISLRQGDTTGAIVQLAEFRRRFPKAPPAVALVLADAQRTAGNIDDAIAVYHELAGQFPAEPRFPWLAGVTLARAGRAVDARREFAAALARSPDYLPAVEQLVDLDLAAHDPAAAGGRLAPVLAREPANAAVRVLEAKVAMARGDTAQAETALRAALGAQPDFAPACMLLAQLYVATHRQDKALADLEELAKHNPKDAGAFFLIGTIRDQQKDWPAARDAYEKSLALNPRSVPVLNNLAYLYGGPLHDLAKAADLAQRARQLQPGEPHTADTLAWILLQQHKYSWALDLLQESAAKLPAAAEIQYHLGLAHYLMAEIVPARAALRHALAGDLDAADREDARRHLEILDLDVSTANPSARATLERAVAGQPDDPVAQERLGALDEREGRDDLAASAYRAALAGNPRNLGALSRLARLLARTGHLADAFALARKAHEDNPNDLAIDHLLGRLALDSGDLAWAVSLLQPAAQAAGADAEALSDYALALYRTGAVKDATAAMRDALERQPSAEIAASARSFLDLVALADSPDPAAAERVEAALHRAPGDLPALMARAALAVQRHDPAAAERDANDALAQCPQFVPAMRLLAILLSDRASDDARVIDLATKARAKFPSDPALALALGAALHRQGRDGAAEPVLREALAGQPDNARTQLQLGLTLAGLGRTAESGKALQRALDLGLPPDLAAAARAALAR